LFTSTNVNTGLFTYYLDKYLHGLLKPYTMPRKHDLKFVWPKDGPKGKSGHRGFWGRLNNVVTNRGPDVFIQRKNDSRGIQPECWGNWYNLHAEKYERVNRTNLL